MERKKIKDMTREELEQAYRDLFDLNFLNASEVHALRLQYEVK